MALDGPLGVLLGALLEKRLHVLVVADQGTGSSGLLRPHRARGATHHQALRALGKRLVGILDGCLRHHNTYGEARLAPVPKRLFGVDGGVAL